MGMYTELFISTRIKNEEPVVEIIKYLTGKQIEDLQSLPDHEFFKCQRWKWLLNCSSYYFVPRNMSLFEYDHIGKYWVLISRSDLKNYNGEIEKFINWLMPYLDVIKGEMIGYSRYEEYREPTIIYKE